MPRRGSFKPMRGGGPKPAMNPSRRVWLVMDKMQVILYRYMGNFADSLPEESRQASEYSELITDNYGDEHTITFIQNGRKFSLNLTRFTSEELMALENFIVRSIARARPIVVARDRIVKELYDEQGDDSHERLYRELPILHARAGDVEQYREGVRVGSPNVPSVEQFGWRVSPILPGARNRLDERDAIDDGPEDDDPSNDIAEDVREVGTDQEG